MNKQNFSSNMYSRHDAALIPSTSNIRKHQQGKKPSSNYLPSSHSFHTNLNTIRKNSLTTDSNLQGKNSESLFVRRVSLPGNEIVEKTNKKNDFVNKNNCSSSSRSSSSSSSTYSNCAIDDSPQRPIQRVVEQKSYQQNQQQKATVQKPKQNKKRNQSIIELDNGKLIYKATTNTMTKCCIIRNKDGIDGGIHPTYFLYQELEGTDNRQLLLSAKKWSATKSCFNISTDPTNLTKKGSGFIGKLKTDLLARCFTFHEHNVGYKDEIVAIKYEYNPLGMKGPRKMTIVLPNYSINNSGRNLINSLESRWLDNLTVLNNKKPVWNDADKSYQLNFGGRVKLTSVKNFQIVNSNDEDDILLCFGKNGDHEFILDFRHPFSPLSAFSVALSSLDH